MNRINANRPTRLYQRDLIAIAICFLLLAVNVSATEHTPVVQNSEIEKVATSIGKASNTSSVKTNRVVTKQVPRTKARKKAGTQPSQSLSPDYEIFDAVSSIYYDDDLDGHFYGLSVNFDADTYYSSDEVYARLYLSLEGGPWELYYTTEVFTIFGDSSDDDYTVDTELFTGYPTGYYDVLIELYDYHYNDLVAEFGPFESSALDELPLEDQQKDNSGIIVSPPSVSFSEGSGGGSTSALIIGLLLSIGLARARNSQPRRAVKVLTKD